MAELRLVIKEVQAGAVRRGSQRKAMLAGGTIAAGTRAELHVQDAAGQQTDIVEAVITSCEPLRVEFEELTREYQTLNMFEPAEVVTQRKVSFFAAGQLVQPWGQRSLSRDLGYTSTAALCDAIWPASQQPWQGQLIGWRLLGLLCKYDTNADGDCGRCKQTGGCAANGGPFRD